MNKIIRILKYQNFNKLRLLCPPMLHRSPRNDRHCDSPRRGSNLIVSLISFFVLHFTLYTLHGFCIEPAQLFWEDASGETDSNIAVDKLKKIVEKYPDNPRAVDAQYLIAEHKYMEGNYTRAYQEFQILVEKFHRSKYSSLAWYRRACCLFAAGEYDEAIKEFRQSLLLDSWAEHSVLAKIGIADAYFAKNNFQKALREYKSILPGQPFQQYILYKITLCHQKISNTKEFKMSKKELGKKYPLSLEFVLIESVQEPNVTVKQASLDVVGDSKVIEPINIPVETTWTIQVGSFTREENARNLSAALIRKGYISWIQPVKIGEGFFYRVYLGKFKTEEETKKKAEEVNHKENLPTRIVELK